jgi:hypothetical protein
MRFYGRAEAVVKKPTSMMALCEINDVAFQFAARQLKRVVTVMSAFHLRTIPLGIRFCAF